MGQKINGAPVPLAVETIRRIAEQFALEEVTIRIDPNGSSLGKARARALEWAHGTGSEVWVSCDDDVTASPGTLSTLVRLTRDVETPRIVVVPCALRDFGKTHATVNVIPVVGAQPLPGNLLLPLYRGGFGLVAMNRAALVAIRDQRPNVKDDDGSRIPLVFNCQVSPGHEWLGEDFSFFDQVRNIAECLMLLRGESDHAGSTIDLESVLDLFIPKIVGFEI